MKHTKRILSVLLALLVLALSVPFAAAEDVTVVDSGTCGKNLTWSLDSEGTLTISGEGNMPSSGTTYDSSLGITRTDAPWGLYVNSIINVVIGDNVTNIGGYAFYYCIKLASVTIGNSVTSIGYEAFWGCTALKSVMIGNSVTSIGSSAFRDCTALASVTIPDSVTSIGNYAFRYCTALTSVTIGDSVTSIGNSAFEGCGTLNKIYISDLSPWVSISGLSNLMNYGSSHKELYQDAAEQQEAVF